MKRLFQDPIKRWQLGLTLLVGVFLVAMAATFVCAGRKVSRVVDADYYQHGLHYGETLRHAERTAGQWKMTPSLVDRQLRVEVRDASGAPVTGGAVIFRPRGGSAPASAEMKLSETAAGIYTLPSERIGSQERHGTLRFTKADATLSSQVVLFE